MRTPALARLAGVPALLLSTAAAAHPGHGLDAGLIHGLSHPLLGLDHLLAMLAVGLWAAQLGGTARVWVPGAFIAMVGVGLALGAGGAGVPGVELGIAGSVLLFGLLILCGAKLPTGAGVGLAAVFALYHGHAHGVELIPGVGVTSFAAGMLIATALLHGFGLALGSLARTSWLRAGGGLIAASGGALLAGLI